MSKYTNYVLGGLLVFLLCFPHAVHAQSVTLFEDDFEDATLDAWVVQPEGTWTNSVSNAHSGTRKARVAGNVEGAVMQRDVSTVGYTDIVVTFWHDTNTGWDAQDLLEMQWSVDGSTWHTGVVIDGDDRTPLEEGGDEWIEHVVVPGVLADNQPTFGIRFVATITGTSDIVYVDDVHVSGTASGGGGQPTPTPTPTPTVIVTPSPTPTTVVTPTPTQQPQPTPTQAPQPTPTVVVTPIPSPPDNGGGAMGLISLLVAVVRQVFTLLRLLMVSLFF